MNRSSLNGNMGSQWKPGSGFVGKIASWLGLVILVLAVWWGVAQLGVLDAVWGVSDAQELDSRPTQVIAAERSDLEAMERLLDLRVRQGRSVSGYDRSAFGEAWADVDGNGCDTRNDVLQRDLDQVRFRRGSDCVVSRGILKDPYVGVTIHFERGLETSPVVQVDHVVALGDAWRAGAWEWTPAQRQEFANDPNNLLAVEGQANQDKGSARADQWLPPRAEFWCEYVTRQINVKYDWDLTVTEAERDTMIRALATCPKL